MPERTDRISDQRILARRQLDVCGVGTVTWHGQRIKQTVPETVGTAARGGAMGMYISVRQRDMDHFQGGQYAAGVAVYRQDIYRGHRTGIRTFSYTFSADRERGPEFFACAALCYLGFSAFWICLYVQCPAILYAAIQTIGL